MDIKVNDKKITDKYAIYNADSTEWITTIKDESVGLIVYSPPFSSLYTYSNSDRDLGNSRNDEEFFTHFEFIVKELYRVLMSGRIMAVHCMQIPAMKERDGYIGLKDFRGDLIRLFQKCGFIYHSETTVYKSPVTEMQRTKALGLLHKQVKKDSAMSRMGLPDYVVFMRKPGVNPKPITHTNETYPVSKWQVVAEPTWSADIYPDPVWFDINQSDTLNRLFSDEESERHICFAEGTLVLSKRGYIPIELLDVGIDEVLTESGKWHKVIAKEKTGENKKVVQVRANGVPHLVCTPDHKIKAKKMQTKGARTTKEATMRQDEAWVKAEDCEKHYLKSVMPPELESNISTVEWWIIGRYLADGHVDARGKQYFISVGVKKWEKFKEIAKQYIGMVNDKSDECNCLQIGLIGLSSDARDILKRIGRGARNKVVPYECISLNKELSKAFLDGYESGDGCICNNKRLYSSASRSLILSMAIVMQKVYGIVPSVYLRRKEHDSVIRGKKIHGGNEWCSVLSPHYSFSFEDKNGITWKKVKSVIEHDNADVWSIEVEEDHSFLCEGVVVKNCPLQLCIIDRIVDLYSNPEEIVLTPFMGIGSEVYQAVKMGRKGIGCELKKEYYLQAVKNLESLEDEMAQTTIFDFLGIEK